MGQSQRVLQSAGIKASPGTAFSRVLPVAHGEDGAFSHPSQALTGGTPGAGAPVQGRWVAPPAPRGATGMLRR